MGSDSFSVEGTEQHNNARDNPNNTIPTRLTGDRLSLDRIPVEELEQMITTLEYMEECKQRILGEKNDEAKRIEAELQQIQARKKAFYSNQIVQARVTTKWSIDELNLSVRSYNRLRRAGIQTIAELCAESVESLMKKCRCGIALVEEIGTALAQKGLCPYKPTSDGNTESEDSSDYYELQAELEHKFFDELFGSLDDDDD